MLKNEDAFGFQQFVLKDNVGYLWQIRQGIRWVSKNKIKRLADMFDVSENIRADNYVSVGVQLLGTLANESDMFAVGFNTYNLLASS